MEFVSKDGQPIAVEFNADTPFVDAVTVTPGKGMSVLADSLLSQTPGAVPMIFDVGFSHHEAIIAPTRTGMSGYGFPAGSEGEVEFDLGNSYFSIERKG